MGWLKNVVSVGTDYFKTVNHTSNKNTSNVSY